jgi:hypothetical protein
LAAFFLAGAFFAAFFLAAIIHYLLRFFYDPISCITATHRASPRSLNDEVSVTLAVVRNGSRTRVVLVVSVVTTTSRIAIQVVLIPEWNAHVKGLVRFFFVKCPVKCFECGTFTMEMDLSKDHQHIACERCEIIWCAVCLGRVEVKISRAWLEQQRAAPLN